MNATRTIFFVLFLMTLPALGFAETQAPVSAGVGIAPWIVLVVLAIVRVFCCFLETACGFSIEDEVRPHEGRTAEL